MTGPYHRRDLAFALVSIGCLPRERADAAAAREGHCAGFLALADRVADLVTILLGDAGVPQRLLDTARAKTAPSERRRARLGKAAVVDIAALDEAIGQFARVRRRFTLPSALGQLACEIGGETGSCGRETFDITERKPLEGGLVQGRKRSAGTVHTP